MPGSFTVLGRRIGEDAPCFIVAEGGLNHNGDINIALKLAAEAKRIGADAIKFQKRTISKILTREAFDKPYINENSFGATYGKHREKLELSKDDWARLFEYCRSINLLCFASPWDQESVDFLMDFNMPLLKVASADLTNLPLLGYIASKRRPVILSTGMSTMEEVDVAVNTVGKISPDLGIMHCVSTYPFEAEIANLRVIQTLAARYPNVVVGYSGHEKSGLVVSLAAVALGAKIIERHFTLDRTMRGPDHAASLEVGGFSQLVEDIRKVEASLGDGIKRIHPSELSVRQKLSKSVTASCHIPHGTVLKRDMLVMKSPGTGLPGSYLELLLGRIAQQTINEDEQLPSEALKWPLTV
jgi:N-acetylneuraminate synthase/sialic acid synthase